MSLREQGERARIPSGEIFLADTAEIIAQERGRGRAMSSACGAHDLIDEGSSSSRNPTQHDFGVPLTIQV
jgi:hypothetical protein